MELCGCVSVAFTWSHTACASLSACSPTLHVHVQLKKPLVQPSYHVTRFKLLPLREWRHWKLQEPRVDRTRALLNLHKQTNKQTNKVLFIHCAPRGQVRQVKHVFFLFFLMISHVLGNRVVTLWVQNLVVTSQGHTIGKRKCQQS